MTKIKNAFILILAVTLIFFMCTGVTAIAVADTTEQVINFYSSDTEVIAGETEISASNLDELAEKFTAYLKERYGADYEYYYNQIIENWGSVEAYLLAFGNKLPEKQQDSWQKFVGWLTEYSAVWAPALAVMLLIIVGLIGKKQLNRIIERTVNAKFSPIVRELNLQSKATAVMLSAQKALFAGNDKFTDTVAKIAEAEKELKGE